MSNFDESHDDNHDNKENPHEPHVEVHIVDLSGLGSSDAMMPEGFLDAIKKIAYEHLDKARAQAQAEITDPKTLALAWRANMVAQYGILNGTFEIVDLEVEADDDPVDIEQKNHEHKLALDCITYVRDMLGGWAAQQDAGVDYVEHMASVKDQDKLRLIAAEGFALALLNHNCVHRNLERSWDLLHMADRLDLLDMLEPKV
jgi:hypothetical protein